MTIPVAHPVRPLNQFFSFIEKDVHQESIDLDSSKSSSPTKKRKIEDKLNDKRPKIRKVEVDFVELDDTNEENEFDMGSDSEFTTSNKKSKLVKNKKKATEKVTVPTLTLKKLNSNEVHEYEVKKKSPNKQG